MEQDITNIKLKINFFRVGNPTLKKFLVVTIILTLVIFT